MLSQPSLICGEKLQVNHYHINSGITLLNVRRTGTCLYRMSDFPFAIDRHLRRDWHLTKCKHRFWLELKPLKNSNFRVLPFLLLYCIFPRARGQEPVTVICDISLAAVEWGFANVLFPSWFWDPSFCWLRSQVSSIKWGWFAKFTQRFWIIGIKQAVLGTVWSPKHSPPFVASLQCLQFLSHGSFQGIVVFANAST